MVPSLWVIVQLTEQPLCQRAGESPGRAQITLESCGQDSIGLSNCSICAIEPPGAKLRHARSSQHSINIGQATLVSLASSGKQTNLVDTPDRRMCESDELLPPLSESMKYALLTKNRFVHAVKW